MGKGSEAKGAGMGLPGFFWARGGAFAGTTGVLAEGDLAGFIAVVCSGAAPHAVVRLAQCLSGKGAGQVLRCCKKKASMAAEASGPAGSV